MNILKPDPIFVLAIIVVIGVVVTTLVRPGNQAISTVVKAHEAKISAQYSPNYIKISTDRTPSDSLSIFNPVKKTRL